MRISDEFRRILTDVDVLALEDEQGVMFGMFADGRLALTNEGWDRFAAENGEPDLNGEWPLGRSVYDAIPDDLQEFYREGWEWVAATGRPWSHTYECSSPRDYRRYRMTSYPVGDGRGIIVVNSLVADRRWPDDEPSVSPRQEYRSPDDTVTQCPHCRRTRHVPTGRWDWVPEWVHRWPERGRGSLCELCVGYHYYDLRRHAPGVGAR